MNTFMRCLVLSLMIALSCQLFYETIVPRKRRHPEWINNTATAAFTAGFLLISYAAVPPFVLRPVRIILITVLTAQFYFQIQFAKNLILSVLFCGIYWMISTMTLSVLSLFMNFTTESSRQILENLTEGMNLCLMMLFYHQCKHHIRGIDDIHWKSLGFLPFLFLFVVMAINMIPYNITAANNYARLAAISGFAVLSIFLFYFAMRILEKEETLQKLQLRTEHTRRQMAMFRTMQKQYEQQRQFLHDYKNQLNCIQGLINCGQTEEASAYITRLTGSLRAQYGDINTNNTIVNIILNQKYQTAKDKKITMAFVINDLSALAMPEEDLVTLLANLLDNALEACDRLSNPNPEMKKIIQFKMVLEDDQLIVSVRNPVDQPVTIKNKTIATSKKNAVYHGIGLSNVDSVIQKYNGTSALICEDGWFSFTAIMPFFAV